MRQILMNSGGAVVARVPRPAIEAGSVLAGRVVEHLADWYLTRVEVAGQRITVPQLDAPLGATVRLRIRARDVALQREMHTTSASNQP